LVRLFVIPGAHYNTGVPSRSPRRTSRRHRSHRRPSSIQAALAENDRGVDAKRRSARLGRTGSQQGHHSGAHDRDLRIVQAIGHKAKRMAVGGRSAVPPQLTTVRLQSIPTHRAQSGGPRRARPASLSTFRSPRRRQVLTAFPPTKRSGRRRQCPCGRASSASTRRITPQSTCHYDKAQILRAQGRCQEAIPEYETTISLDANFASAYANLGWRKFLTGSIEDVTAPSSLTPQFRGRDVCRPGDADGAFVVLLAMAQAHVDTAAEEIFVERVGPFVHRMAGDRGDRAALLGQQPASSSSALPRHRARNQVRS
jgi:hypothetical protein